MKSLRPVYANNLNIRVGGLNVRRLALNRHLPEALWIEDHAHHCSQFLLYLSGKGEQVISGQRHLVENGRFFYIPPGVQHAFIESSGRKPLCLAIDFTLTSRQSKRHVTRRLSQLDLNEIRRALLKLGRWKTDRETIEPREAAAVLDALDVLLHAAELLPTRRSPNIHPILQKARRLLDQPEVDPLALSELARKIGYQPAYLNRILKQVCGLTLGQLRNEHRMERASRLLLSGKVNIAEVAMESGFADPNYFSRWFRKQSGRTPMEYRDDMTDKGVQVPSLAPT